MLAHIVSSDWVMPSPTFLKFVGGTREGSSPCLGTNHFNELESFILQVKACNGVSVRCGADFGQNLLGKPKHRFVASSKRVTSILENFMFGVTPNAHPTYRRNALLTELM